MDNGQWIMKNCFDDESIVNGMKSVARGIVKRQLDELVKKGASGKEINDAKQRLKLIENA